VKEMYRADVLTPPSDVHVFVDRGEVVDLDGGYGVRRNGLIWTDTKGWHESESEAYRQAAIKLEAFMEKIRLKIVWCLEQASESEVRHANQMQG
jgi:hypothetical protein